MTRMTVLENVYNAVQSFGRAKAGETAKWYEAHPRDGELFDFVMELRIKHGVWGR